jgi:glutathione S-transferase
MQLKIIVTLGHVANLIESSAIMVYICNKYHLYSFYPASPEHKALVDAALAYQGTAIYPLVARACYPVFGFALNVGEIGGGSTDVSADVKKKAQQECIAALGDVLDNFRTFFLPRSEKWIGHNATPTIADIRFASTVEYLDVLPYKLPPWLVEYMAQIELALGRSYLDVAHDVRQLVAQTKTALLQRK